MSAARWRQYLHQNSFLPLSLLRLTTSRVHDAIADIADGNVIGQQTIQRQILNVLSGNGTIKIIALTGLPGSGKTTLVQVAARSLQKLDSSYEVAFIQLIANPDFESILNHVLEQLHLDYKIADNFAKKQRYIRKILQQRRCLIVIDEGNTHVLGNATIYRTLINMFEGAHILCAAQSVPAEDCLIMPIAPLKAANIRQMMIRAIPALAACDEALFADIAQITGGLPLGVNFVIGLLKEQRFQIGSFVDEMRYVIKAPWDASRVNAVYEEILSWLWRWLLPNEKLILTAVSMFDSTNGASVDDITTLCATLRPDIIKSKINTLCEMSLLRCQGQLDKARRYSLDSISHKFIREGSTEGLAGIAAINKLDKAYIEHFLDYIELRYPDFPALDQQTENIVRMFEMVLLGERHTKMRHKAVDALRLVFPYFEKRGLYEVANKLITAALQLPDTPIEGVERVELLHFAGQIAYKRSMPDVSEQYLKQAAELADSLKATELYGEIYLDYGLVFLQNSQFSQAMQCFETANQWALHHEQLLVLCRVAGNSGACASRQGLYDLAEQYFKQVGEYVKDDDIEQLPYAVLDVVQFALTGLGTTASEAWEYEQAEAYYQQAMELARRVNSPERIGYLYLNLGVTKFFQNVYDETQEYFLQGKIIADRIQHEELSTLTTWNQGALMSAQHQYEEAEGLLKSALMQASDLSLGWMETSIYISMGKLYFRQHVMPEAKLSFLSALARSGKNPKSTARALYGLSLIEMAASSVIGVDDTALATGKIGALLQSLDLGMTDFSYVSAEDLEKAQKFFQQDLHGYPQLHRFHIVEALRACIEQLGTPVAEISS